MLIYLASPYTSSDVAIREENYRKISMVAAKMIAEGYVVFSPITYGHHLSTFHDMPLDWKFWEGFCFAFLKNCDKMIICKMPGWDISHGVSEEIKFATEREILIEYMDYTE